MSPLFKVFAKMLNQNLRRIVLSLLYIAALVSSSNSLVVHAQQAPDKQAKPKVELPSGITWDFDVPYINDGDPAQRLDIYYPEQMTSQPLPLIVHIHGGGWMGGSKFPCDIRSMTKYGYVVASVEYRFSQKAKFPAQIQDCQAAIRWLRANAQRYNINPEKIGVIGGSAGGHLSALVGVAGGKRAFTVIGGNEDQSDAVQCVCDIFGPTNFASVVEQAENDKNVKNIFKFNTPSDPYSELIGAKLSDKDKTAAVSPITYVDKNCPPTLILHGTHDTLVPFAQSEELEAAMKKQGVPVWLQTFPGAGHGGGAFSKPSVVLLTKKLFDKYLQGAEVNIELIPEAELAQ
ncbi:MAG: alpha/beta hydrolase [Pirellulales bacterium]